ncbi:MAG TPA: hypothetical protein VGD84_15565, partial [Pseudonocardiaceae bacterium]
MLRAFGLVEQRDGEVGVEMRDAPVSSAIRSSAPSRSISDSAWHAVSWSVHASAIGSNAGGKVRCVLHQHAVRSPQGAGAADEQEPHAGFPRHPPNQADPPITSPHQLDAALASPYECCTSGGRLPELRRAP